MYFLIDLICNRAGYKLCLGDFNFPNINWNTWNTAGSTESKFIDTLRKHFYNNMSTLQLGQEDLPLHTYWT